MSKTTSNAIAYYSKDFKYVIERTPTKNTKKEHVWKLYTREGYGSDKMSMSDFIKVSKKNQPKEYAEVIGKATEMTDKHGVSGQNMLLRKGYVDSNSDKARDYMIFVNDNGITPMERGAKSSGFPPMGNFEAKHNWILNSGDLKNADIMNAAGGMNKEQIKELMHVIKRTRYADKKGFTPQERKHLDETHDYKSIQIVLAQLLANGNYKVGHGLDWNEGKKSIASATDKRYKKAVANAIFKMYTEDGSPELGYSMKKNDIQTYLSKILTHEPLEMLNKKPELNMDDDPVKTLMKGPLAGSSLAGVPIDSFLNTAVRRSQPHLQQGVARIIYDHMQDPVMRKKFGMTSDSKSVMPSNPDNLDQLQRYFNSDYLAHKGWYDEAITREFKEVSAKAFAGQAAGDKDVKIMGLNLARKPGETEARMTALFEERDEELMTLLDGGSDREHIRQYIINKVMLGDPKQPKHYETYVKYRDPDWIKYELGKNDDSIYTGWGMLPGVLGPSKDNLHTAYQGLENQHRLDDLTARMRKKLSNPTLTKGQVMGYLGDMNKMSKTKSISEGLAKEGFDSDTVVDLITYNMVHALPGGVPATVADRSAGIGPKGDGDPGSSTKYSAAAGSLHPDPADGSTIPSSGGGPGGSGGGKKAPEGPAFEEPVRNRERTMEDQDKEPRAPGLGWDEKQALHNKTIDRLALRSTKYGLADSEDLDRTPVQIQQEAQAWKTFQYIKPGFGLVPKNGRNVLYEQNCRQERNQFREPLLAVGDQVALPGNDIPIENQPNRAQVPLSRESIVINYLAEQLAEKNKAVYESINGGAILPNQQNDVSSIDRTELLRDRPRGDVFNPVYQEGQLGQKRKCMPVYDALQVKGAKTDQFRSVFDRRPDYLGRFTHR